MAYGDRPLLDKLATVANLTDGDALPIDERISTAVDVLAGRQNYLATAGTYPAMRNEQLRQRVAALEQVQATQQQFILQLVAGADVASKQMQALGAQLQLQQLAIGVLQTNQAADEVRLAAVEAKATLTASATEANRLDIIKLQAADVLLQAQDSKDATAIAATQATATQARAEAATAQKKADDDAAALLVLQGQLTTVQATANAAQQAAAANATALAGKLDAAAVQRFTITTPAVSLVVGTPYAVPVVLPKAWANGNYLVFFTKASGSTLLNVQLSDTAKTGTGFNTTMQTTGLATLAVGAGSAEVLAIQLA
ncbi:MAG: hypothetical protein ACRYFZ_09800 [Janthinobacterium lividum]